jgi:putative protease
MIRPEVLAPAGDMEHLIFAVTYGADAVYLAGPDFGMRRDAGNFDGEALKQAVAFCHARNVKVYVTCNTLPRNEEMKRLPAFLEQAADAQVDALILTDLGAFSMALRYAPDIERHVSTQAGIVNYESACMWYSMGAQRVVLARELTLEEIREIREKTPRDLELEAFVHGSMCVSFSGRCLLSNYMTGRDANRGACAQPCRYQYALVEEKRPGEYYPIFEDAAGTYIMNAKDLCMIDHIPEVLDAGVDSLKIEGRAKTAYYAAVITNAYRHGVDAALAGQPLDPVWRAEVDKVSHRHYSTGFFYGRPEHGQYYDHSRYLRDWSVVAYVKDCDEAGNAILTQRNRFWKGDQLELLIPGEVPVSFQVNAMQNKEGEEIEIAPHPEMEIRMKLPCRAVPNSILRKCNLPAEK